MIDLTLPGYWGNNSVSFSAANGVKAKILADVTPAQVVAAVSGESTLPGEASVRQRVLQGGCRIADGLISSTDAIDKALLLYIGKQMTLYANMGTATTTATSNSTITRSAGSFILDGWQVGDTGMVFGSIVASAANDGAIWRVTAVVAGTLTLDGITGISVAGTEAAGFRLFKVGFRSRRKVAANAGNTDIIANAPLFGDTVDKAIDPSCILLDANGSLIVGMAAAVAALPAIVTASAQWGLY